MKTNSLINNQKHHHKAAWAMSQRRLKSYADSILGITLVACFISCSTPPIEEHLSHKSLLLERDLLGGQGSRGYIEFFTEHVGAFGKYAVSSIEAQDEQGRWRRLAFLGFPPGKDGLPGGPKDSTGALRVATRPGITQFRIYGHGKDVKKIIGIESKKDFISPVVVNTYINLGRLMFLPTGEVVDSGVYALETRIMSPVPYQTDKLDPRVLGK